MRECLVFASLKPFPKVEWSQIRKLTFHVGFTGSLREKWSAYVFLFSTIYINGKQEYEKK
jgi:hypothetical protein